MSDIKSAAQALGRLGGAAKSARKAEAARRNGLLGGANNRAASNRTRAKKRD